ncbi:MAG: TPR repeat protein [Oleiphilaceae bacterium]|jgi:TPR repeat protein
MKEMITDLELVSSFGKHVSQTYDTAIKFIELNPDHSLVEFRSLATLICNDILVTANEDFKCWTLAEKIENLFGYQLIENSTKVGLHKIRKLGNSSAHKNDLISIKDEELFIKLSKENQMQEANQVRNIVIEVLSDLYVFWLKKGPLPKIHKIENKLESYKELLFEGVIATNHESKYLAGMVYKSLAEDYSRSLPLIFTDDENTKLVQLYECAVAHFKASYKLSVNIGFNLASPPEKETFYIKHCDLNSLYEYASILYSECLGEDKIPLGIELLTMAAERGFGRAQADLACYLYDKGDKYLLAKKYAEKASRQNVVEGNRLLFHYFSEGKATKPNIELALSHIDKAIKTGCSQALFDLGSAYFESDYMVQNLEKSKGFLLQAIKQGHQQAFLYYEINYNNFTEKVASNFKLFSNEMFAALESQTPKKQLPIRSQKKKPNEKCWCESGVKYKKCHGSPSELPRQS